jgi:hypothetical protein
MACQEKTTLLNKYLAATESFIDSLTLLSAKINVLQKPDYDRFRQAMEGFRAKAEEARTEFEKHVASHGC